MSASDVPTDGPLGRFIADLIASEFPDLPAERAELTAAFCRARCDRLPHALRLGVELAAKTAEQLGRIGGTERVRTAFRRTRIPLVGDLARLVRSLVVAFIWERWPDTGPLGAPVVPVEASP